ncbi:MAG: RNA polymerase factor sigma-54 [SAR86 cluster bacterium]|jgi:RNA polymerase sigma-54 factor|nr:RNA polymerase factor sigma-54 [SAR86 cluster bacterium]MBL6822546.1 RNA polymerase factor sigma-54 [SAR86 cluster bacterium]MDA8799459.1 RNA polymerase factor sigma-54 [Gammaproteobacteria bacterium]MDA9935995.1 RNA polymerase factor sigma-54 [Gammaproteobacteria bacterium]MDC0918816.1 RNA polymerase factor sigma-54 [Gammaproteobacteria bacterium]|tara:strand:+ start:1955 stop:3220 length:1266 start_codon:yes stop_codon:yes gene_type:complete
MVIKLVREFRQNQQLSITPQLKKSIDLLQLSRLEIINKINNEIDENPFLKKDFESESVGGFDNEGLIENLPNELSLQKHLEVQLEDIKLNNTEKTIALVIIQSLEENGLLQIDLDEIEALMEFSYSTQEIESVLNNIIQDLDPPGVGARNFKETIYIQLRKKDIPTEELEIANKILFNPKFSSFEDAQADLAIHYSKNSIESVLEKIKKCDLSPGLEFESTHLIQPDLEVIPDSNQNFNVRFRQDNFPLISLDQDLEKQVKNKANKVNKKLKEKIGEAKWLIRSINKRNETVQNVGTLICRIQADFLSDRCAELKPLSNVELAKELKISPSTVSRILRSKYIQTPKGAVSMKSLLASSVSKTRKVTPMQLMEEIQNIVEGEKKKLSDQKISDLLNKRGFNLARRTIAKYRKKINLPNSRNR